MFHLQWKNISNLKKNALAFSNKCFNHDKKNIRHIRCKEQIKKQEIINKLTRNQMKTD